MRNTLLPAIVLALACAGPLAAEEGFRVIVNADNPVEQLTRVQASEIFLKQRTRWVDDTPVSCVDQPASSSARTAFSRRILGRSVDEVQTYWQRQIFSGRGVPPAVKASDRDVVAYVAAKPGAIGYVSVGAAMTDGVKVLTVVE